MRCVADRFVSYPQLSPHFRQHANNVTVPYARVRWLISLLYLMGLRISEVVSNPMGGFFRRRDRDGQDRWWLAITGKGDKERLLPATTELMAELARYRPHYDL